MSGDRSCADPPTGGHALRHATGLQSLPSQLNGQEQHSNHRHHHRDHHQHQARSAFLDKADSLLLARSQAPTFSTPRTAVNSGADPLASFPPPAPPKPAHYSVHNHRRPPFSPLPPPQDKDKDITSRSTSPPSYTSRLASFARTFSPPLPPRPLKKAVGSSSALSSHRQHNRHPRTAKMVSCGRVVCVALPFVLAVISIAALLVAALAGVADKNLYMFEVNTTALSVSPADAVNILSRAVSNGAALDTRAAVPIVAAPLARAAAPAPVGFHDASVARASVGFHDPSLLTDSGKSDANSATSGTTDGASEKATAGGVPSGNITAADLALGNLYDIGLWNYCVKEQNGTRTCSKPEFNWAEKTLNNSENSVTSLISSTGTDLKIPKDITNAIKVFGTLAKWTQVVFIIAFGALALEIIFGLFTACSRGVACVTFLIASITVVAVVGAAGLATAMSIVVVAAIKAEANKYGVDASANSRFLVAVWISAAAAIAASFFWMFTVCCCSPESRRDRYGPRHLDDKSIPPSSSYQPLNDPSNGGMYNNANAYAPQYGAPRYPQGGRSDLAYEPYSHSRV
ncbi:integral membrane protein [Sporothrix brasiliensis 5110]|uniref:Integral membrane protein n=1 Tax=Sporothrix brasiliensis 5110 TaxID=1398154 RepID=A0A0C2FLD7_9PEZI|nr:uncharacterized protein SPBR_01451 [Sporothrix brasiliensis 5110]KIH91898.1 integral membrane protein [Sporothrix brasiliensis 5110]